MELIPYDLRLDVGRMGSQASVAVKRGDRHVRMLRVRLFSGTNPMPLAEGTLGVLRGVKPDGTILFNDCATRGNVIEQVMTEQMLAAAGLLECELTVYGKDGEVLTTPRFDVYIEDVLYPDALIESTDEYTGLTEAMRRLAVLEAEAKENEDERAALYEQVKEDYETGAFIGPEGEAATLTIDEAVAAETDTEAAFVELPGSTAQARRYRAVLPRGKTGAAGAKGD